MTISSDISPLKITHFASGDLWAGAEKQLYTLVTKLSQNKAIQIEVILMNEGELSSRLKNNGINVVVFDETIDNAVVIFFNMFRYLKNTRPDVIHTHGQKENILASIANNLTCRAVNVRTVHGAPEHTLKGIRHFYKVLLRKMDNWTGRYLADKVVAVTNDLKNKLEASFDHERLAVIVNGINLEVKTASDKTPGIRDKMSDKYHIGIAGRIYQVKRVDIFLEIARLLLSRNSERWQFHVFGDGPLRETYEAQSRELLSDDSVIFHGHRQDMENCLASLDLLIMCSDHEGMPMVALESIAAGTLVMAHATGGLVELLQPGQELLLVSRNDAEIYAQKIEELSQLDNTDLIRNLQLWLEENYSDSENSESWLNLYRGILESRVPGYK